MTFVILSGGIDLSVGSVIALTTMVSASLVEQHGWSPALVIPLVLAMGTLFGAFMGFLIERFRLQPFIVTLAGMFLARGLCYLISIDSISITNAFYSEVSQIAHAGLGRGLDLGQRADRAGGGGARRSSSRTTRPSAAPSTRSAATSSRRC